MSSAAPLHLFVDAVMGDINQVDEVSGENESRYRTLFEGLQETFACDELLYDASGNAVDWRIVDVNPAYERFFQVVREEVVGQRASSVYGAETVASHLPLFQQVAESGQPSRVDYSCGDKVFLVSVFPLGNRRLGTLGLDVTEQRRAQRERERLLAEVEGRVAENDAIINAIADALIIYGPQGEIERMNPVAEKFFNYTVAERGRRLSERAAELVLETVEGKPLPLEETPVWRALRGETVSGFVLRCRRDHRQPFWVSISAAPIRTGGTQTGAVVTFTDISALRELQEQRQIYLSTISHDLRTPLTVIHGHAQLLDSMVRNEAARASIEAILQGSRSMEAMIDALVNSAYLESGQLTLKQETVLLDVFIRDLLHRIGAALQRQEIAADLPDGLPPVLADPVRLERILLNLFSNAAKYSPAGTPVLVQAWQVEDRIAVSVRDQGRGIDAEDLPHIFERFHRTKEGRKGKGIGLGLYIARLLVEAHGGSIRVASTPGEGSTFVFTLPIADAANRCAEHGGNSRR